jgi:hypothetical protein
MEFATRTKYQDAFSNGLATTVRWQPIITEHAFLQLPSMIVMEIDKKTPMVIASATKMKVKMVLISAARIRSGTLLLKVVFLYFPAQKT